VLAPDSRTLLLDALRPPAGMTLDRALATTFTLDLETALTIPLAFAGYALSDTPDPIAVMQAVRSCTDKLDIFCQAGAIVPGRWPSELVGLLENVIHQIPRPRPGHLFHPKLWLLKYSGQADEASSYRLLIMSRNLTQDRSWDAMLRLDSDPTNQRVNPGNVSLQRFFTTLPELAKLQEGHPRRASLSALVDDLRRIWWQLPEDVDEVLFWPIGLPGSRRVNPKDLFTGYRHLIVAPFVTAAGIETIVASSPSADIAIIARPQELQKVGKKAMGDARLFAVSPLACLAMDSVEIEGRGSNESAILGELHAKLYIVESNRRARLFVGSANATDAAFGGNVEFLCELNGGASRLGVEAAIGDDSPLRTILEPVEVAEDAVVDAVDELVRQLEDYLFDVAGVGIFATADQAGHGEWTLAICSRLAVPTFAEGVRTVVNLRVSTLNRPGESLGVVPGTPLDVSFSRTTAAELTGFLLFRCDVARDGLTVARSVVVAAELIGAPATRIEDIVARQIDTPEKFMRLLQLLLGSGPLAALSNDMLAGGPGVHWEGVDLGSGILELVARALAERPSALDGLEALLSRLRQTTAYSDIVPAGWDELWSSVVTARTAESGVGR
jgi:hypothetical protein